MKSCILVLLLALYCLSNVSSQEVIIGKTYNESSNCEGEYIVSKYLDGQCQVDGNNNSTFTFNIKGKDLSLCIYQGESQCSGEKPQCSFFAVLGVCYDSGDFPGQEYSFVYTVEQ